MTTALDPIATYLASIGHYPILTRAQERSADVKTLVNHNLRLVVSIAKAFDVTRERARQIVSDALRKLRAARDARLAVFLEI